MATGEEGEVMMGARCTPDFEDRRGAEPEPGSLQQAVEAKTGSVLEPPGGTSLADTLALAH